MFSVLLILVAIGAKKALSLPTIFSTKSALQTAVDEYCFDSATADSLYGPINTWNVSQITDMSLLFFEKTCNPPIGDWDVSRVTNMEFMFYDASAFNQDVSAWDVSSVTTMYGMFSSASAFNQDISSWDVSHVTDMSLMFQYASAFNQDVSAWDVSKVTTMFGLFADAPAFNQDISAWDVSKVTNMEAMFYRASAFNQDISSWDVSSVTDMAFMFYGASAFSQNLCWDVADKTTDQWLVGTNGATNTATCTPTSSPVEAPTTSMPTTSTPTTAMPTTASPTAMPTTTAPTTATRCMAGYTGDILPNPTTCSAVITGAAADVADIAEAEDKCEFHGGTLDLPSFTAAGAEFTCLSDPIPFSQLHDRMVETQHPYISGQSELFKVALPNTDCYKLWFDVRSEIAASGDFVRVFQYRYRRRGREDGRKRLEPQLRNQFSRFSTQETGFHIDGDYAGVQLVVDDNRRNFGFIAYISSCPVA